MLLEYRFTEYNKQNMLVTKIRNTRQKTNHIHMQIYKYIYKLF